MRLIEINNIEKLVIVDGVTIKVDFSLDDNIRAIHWDESVKSGFVEVFEGKGEVINTMEDYADILEAYTASKENAVTTDYYFRIICDDKLVDVGGDAYELNIDIDPNYNAVIWNGENGFIETKSGRNIHIFNLDEFADIINLHAEKKADDEAEKKAREDEYNLPINVLKREIFDLENEITPRRIREAVLTQDGAEWLALQEGLIESKRQEIAGL